MTRTRILAISIVILCALAAVGRGDDRLIDDLPSPQESPRPGALLDEVLTPAPGVEPNTDAATETTPSSSALSNALTAKATADESAKFPKAYQVPGTDAWWKFGGYVKGDFIHDFEPAGVTDRWVPVTIPTDGFGGQNTLMQAKATRLNLDVRTPTDWGVVRGFVETDFFTSNNQLRIRHAYAEVDRFLAGQTWTTFTDPNAIPRTLDFESCAHSTSAFARGPDTRVVQVPRAVLDEVKSTKPEIYYRVVARVAKRIGDRLRLASEMLAAEKEAAPQVASFRTEHDSLGDRELPNNVYYGVQTVRALENFAISGVPLRHFAHLVNSLAYVKKAAAQAIAELGCMDRPIADAIVRSCDEVLAGKLHEHFVVDMMQGGAGTSTNMNANEVIANRGLELLGHAKGDYRHLHPNDHVNCSQSTNDAYPTAIKLAVIFSLKDTLAAMAELRSQLQAREKNFGHVLKMGRTENQDAVPMTLGQEFGAYAVMVRSAMDALKRSVEELHEINMGATAIGTGINSPPGYADLVTLRLVEGTGLPLKKAENLVEATQDSGAFAQMAATMKRAAVQISKICNDLRWLSSGPRCGLNEINLPPMQPGSSIMPGKVNPVIPEMVSQICYQIVGYDVTISMASEASELELNMAEPIIAYDLLHGLMILKNACVTLATRCVAGITANEERCRHYVQNSIGLVTALNPVIGYEKSAAIAKEALKTGGSVYDLVLQKGWLTKERLDDLLSPANMTDPRQLPG